MGLPNSVESATEFRNNCPPPSSILPSMTSEGTVHAMTEDARYRVTKIDRLLCDPAGVDDSHNRSPRSRILPFYNVTITLLPYGIYGIPGPRYSWYQKEIQISKHVP